MNYRTTSFFSWLCHSMFSRLLIFNNSQLLFFSNGYSCFFHNCREISIYIRKVYLIYTLLDIFSFGPLYLTVFQEWLFLMHSSFVATASLYIHSQKIYLSGSYLKSINFLNVLIFFPPKNIVCEELKAFLAHLYLMW